MQTHAPQHGGARAGAGRPRKYGGSGELRVKDEPDEGSVSGRYDRAKADEMEAKAGLKIIELEVSRGNLVERGAIQAAAATAIQMFTQAVRSIPDELERREGVAADTCEKISVALDQAMAILASELEAMTRLGL